jgi:hypothetical protein
MSKTTNQSPDVTSTSTTVTSSLTDTSHQLANTSSEDVTENLNNLGNKIMTIQTTNTQSSTPNSASSINALRLSANYGATLGVKKLLTTVHVGKPKKANFFRAHASDDMMFTAMILEQKESNETYLVSPDIAHEISDLVRPVQLCAAIDRHNNVSLIPVPLPGEDGNRNPWHESLAQAVEHAKGKWLRISANMSLGGYDVFVAEAPLSEPEWPEYDIEALIEVAFRGKIITSLEHPIVQSLLGRI